MNLSLQSWVHAVVEDYKFPHLREIQHAALRGGDQGNNLPPELESLMAHSSLKNYKTQIETWQNRSTPDLTAVLKLLKRRDATIKPAD